jgi:hypothetical protein
VTIVARTASIADALDEQSVNQVTSSIAESFLWTSFLWSASRINLFLVATHTDLAAGLGFLSEGQKAFSPIVLLEEQ